MPRRLTRSKQMELKKKFWEVDKSGDNKLNFQEMKSLLQQGNAAMTDAQLKALFSRVDADGNGTVDFDEFVEFIYGVPRAYEHTPPSVEQKFTEWYGIAMDGTEFAKFCADCNLIDGKNFKKEDVDHTFMRVVPRGKKKITLKKGRDGFSQFDKLLCLVSDKRNLVPEAIFEFIEAGEMSSSATVADAVRFHDDKSTYTGAHAVGVVKAERGPKESDFDVGPPGDWDPVMVTFRAFAKEGNGKFLTNKEFVKLCEDANLIGKRVSKGDLDIIFTRMRQRKLTPEKFQEALAQVAEKKHNLLVDVQDIVSSCDGPVVHATQADAVRFHDDKDLYTGTHAGK